MNPDSLQVSIKGWLVAGLLGVIFALTTGVPASLMAEEVEPFKFTYPKQRLDAPAFQLQDLNGDAASLEAYRGKVVMVHFWATFCLPCLEEMPVLESLWQEYGGQGLMILGIAGDRGDIEIIREFAEKTGVNFPVLHDQEGLVRNRYKVTALPTTYMVGRDGKISGRAIGTRAWSEHGGREVIETLLDTPASQ